MTGQIGISGRLGWTGSSAWLYGMGDGLVRLAAGQVIHAGLEEARLPGCQAKLGWLCIAGLGSLAYLAR